jgi:hypothetical protein
MIIKYNDTVGFLLNGRVIYGVIIGKFGNYPVVQCPNVSNIGYNFPYPMIVPLGEITSINYKPLVANTKATWQ